MCKTDFPLKWKHWESHCWVSDSAVFELEMQDTKELACREAVEADSSLGLLVVY